MRELDRPVAAGPAVAPGDPGGVRAIERALKLVELVSMARGPSSISDLARALELAPSTTHRILQTLCRQGYVVQYPQTKRYGLGPAIAEIGRAITLRTDLSGPARPHLESLVELTGESANLAALYGTRALYLAQAEPDSMVRVHNAPGSSVALHCSAVGKVLLADFRPAMRDDALRQAGLERFTDRTITDPEALELELERVRRDGHGLDDEEREAGVRCVAAPIRGSSGVVVAAIGVSGPSSRVPPERLPELARMVTETAGRLMRDVRDR